MRIISSPAARRGRTWRGGFSLTLRRTMRPLLLDCWLGGSQVRFKEESCDERIPQIKHNDINNNHMLTASLVAPLLAPLAPFSNASHHLHGDRGRGVRRQQDKHDHARVGLLVGGRQVPLFPFPLRLPSEGRKVGLHEHQRAEIFRTRLHVICCRT